MSSLKKLTPFLKPHLKDAILAPLLMVLEVTMDLAQPRFLQRIVDEGIASGSHGIIVGTGLLMVSFALVGAFGGVGCTVYAVRASQKMGADLRERLFRTVQAFTFANLDKLKTGELVTRLTNDVVQVQEMVLILLRIMIRAPLLLIGSLVMAVVTSPRLAVILAVLVPILAYMLVAATRKGYPLFAAVQWGIDSLNTVMRENLAGVRVVKAFVRHTREEKRFGESNDELMRRSMKAMRLMAIVLPLSMLVVNTGVVAVIWFGGLNVTRGVISVGQIMAFVNYLLQALNAMMMVGMLLIRISRAMASADRIEEVLEAEPTLRPGTRRIDFPSGGGTVEFADVSFGYDGGEDVVQHVSFRAGAGEKVAILGATGAGKSTLINLIPRFHDPSSGEVLINGIDVRSIRDDSLRAEVSVVQQETVLFSGTIGENLRYGDPQAGSVEIELAARIAQAHDFITSFTNGYDTQLGQRGVNLSGGQKQRLAIARAVAAGPKILVLDDCTSAVDVETEARIQEAIAEHLADTTIIIVAQRVSTVLTADCIIVLDDGRIADSGRHTELIERSRIYKDIFDSQLGSGGTGNGG